MRIFRNVLLLFLVACSGIDWVGVRVVGSGCLSVEQPENVRLDFVGLFNNGTCLGLNSADAHLTNHTRKRAVDVFAQKGVNVSPETLSCHREGVSYVCTTQGVPYCERNLYRSNDTGYYYQCKRNG